MTGLELWKKTMMEKVEEMGISEAYRIMNFMGGYAMLDCREWCVGCREGKTCQEGISEFLEKNVN